MNQQFYDLNIETLDDGTIRLKQRDYCGEPAILDLHPAQLAYIADSLSANAPEHVQTQPNWAMERIATLERRLLWVRDRFEECHEALPPDMYERCGDAFEFAAWLTASKTVSSEFCTDFPDASSNASSNATASPLKASLLPLDDGYLPSGVKSDSAHPEQVANIHNGELFSKT
ncbi:MAG: hypothetical protein DID92_2727744207 [Candidatus Nitrotoga sp. SPKER]|nr:MAG: hypothetical protein DID92_2727744207 [Candidatus Nitrotoga sp. SPKER]